MAAVGTLNTLADPYGLIGMKLLPTATTSDRTIKADAIEALKQAPQLVVLGSSRSMRYSPSTSRRRPACAPSTPASTASAAPPTPGP